jgi:type VI secretion system protein ImpE
MTPLEERVASLVRAGDLAGAVAATTAAVKDAPSDIAFRWMLAELLTIQGEIERADSHLDAIMSLDARSAVSVVPFRHTLAAEAARRDFHRAGRVPEFLDGVPTEGMRLRLEAFVHLRAGDRARAAELVAAAEEARPAIAGKVDGTACADFRDLDDIVAGVFEVLSLTGKYYWIPVERVERVEFERPATTLDLVWRKARMVVRDGFDAEVCLPVIYGAETGADDASRLARRTDWIGDPPGPVLGVGQRVFAVDAEREMPMLELTKLELDPV